MEITKKRDRIDGGWDLVAGCMSLSTRSVDGMMNKVGFTRTGKTLGLF